MRQQVPLQQNLLRYSEQFDQAAVWVPTNCTITADTADTLDPFGGNAADILVEDNTNSFHRLEQTGAVGLYTIGRTYTYSIYVKTGVKTWAYVRTDAGTYANYVNLTTGVFDSGNNATNWTEDTGNGWWRLCFSFAAVRTGVMYIYPATGSGGVSYLGVLGTKAIYMFGAQLNEGSSATTYKQTTTTVYNVGTPRKAMPVNQNLLYYSQDFTQTQWPKALLTAAATADTLDPFGGSNAQKFTDTVDGVISSHYIAQSMRGAAAADALRPSVCSFYAKAGTKTFVYLMDPNSGFGAFFNLATGVVGTVSATKTATIESVGNGWYRCTVYNPTTAAAVIPQMGLAMCTTGASYSYQGDGTGTVYVYGAQFVKDSYPRAYVTTTVNAIGVAGARKVGPTSLDSTYNLLLDGNMEAAGTAAWSAVQAVLSKQTGAPHGGTQCLRVAYDGVNAIGAARQVFILVVGRSFRIRGWAHGDSTAIPKVVSNSIVLWTGTASTSWQYFDITVIAGATNVDLYCSNLNVGLYVEFDDCSAVETANRLADGDMESAGITQWTVPAGTMTKSTASPREGTQAGRITSTAGGLAFFQQTAGITNGVIYRYRGWVRTDGVASATLYAGTGGSAYVFNSPDWTWFDITQVADGAGRVAFAVNGAAGAWSEWDGVTVSSADVRRRWDYPQQNLFRYSQDLSNAAWTKVGGELTIDGTLYPNPLTGALTANGLIESLNNIAHPMYQSIIVAPVYGNDVLCCLAYFKAGARGYVWFTTWGGSVGMHINLTTGAIVSIGAAVLGAGCEAVPGAAGWYRVWFSHKAITQYFGIYPETSAGGFVYPGDGLVGIYACNFQVNYGYAPTPYAVTTVAGLNPGTAPSLPSPLTQNLLTYSEQFDNAAWTKQNLVVSPNTAETLDPIGTNTADKVTESNDGVPTTHFTYQVPALVTGATYTFSVYVKPGVGRWWFLGHGGTVAAWFDLQTGTVGTATNCTSAMTVEANGFFRCRITFTATAGSATIVYSAIADASVTYQGNATRTWYLWGADLAKCNVITPYVRSGLYQVNVVG